MLLEHRGLPQAAAKHEAAYRLPANFRSAPDGRRKPRSALQSLPRSALEAARIDGATSWQQVIHIKLPLMMPVLIVTGLLRLIDAFKVLEVILVMTEGGPGLSTEILALRISRTATEFRELGVAAAMSNYLLILLLNRLRARVGVAWRFGLANISRRPASSVIQIVAFGLGIMVLLLLSTVRSDLLDDWQSSLPDDAPNYFVINVQSDQVANITEYFDELGVNKTKMYPMVRARLVEINGRKVSTSDYESERAKRFGFKKGELARAKKSVLARLEKSYKNRDKNESGRIIGAYVSNFLNENPIPGIAWTFEMNKKILPTITLEDVNGVINNFLHDDNRVVIITGPKKVVTEQQVLDALEQVKTKELKPYEDKEVAASLMKEEPAMGKIVGFSKNDELGTKTFVLENGAKITYKKTDFKNDEILFEAFSYGGTSLYTTEELKETVSANGGLFEAGVDGLTKNDMTKMMSGKIASVRPYIGGNDEGMRGNSTPKDLETLFQMIHLYFTLKIRS